MALTIDATNQITIDFAESTNNFSGKNVNVDTYRYVQGTSSISANIKRNSHNLYCDVGGSDFTAQHIRLWLSSIMDTTMNTRANDGLRIYLYDINGNYSYWNVSGSDTYTDLWMNVVIDAENPTSGNADITQIDRIGVKYNLLRNFNHVPSTWLDYLHYGDGYTIYGSNYNLDDVSAADKIQAYGIVQKENNSILIAGSLQIGNTTDVSNLINVGSDIKFVEKMVSDTLYNITIIGNSSSTFVLDNNVFSTETNPYYLKMDDQNINNLQFTNNLVKNATYVKFRASNVDAEVTGNVFYECGVVYPQGSKFENNTFNKTTSIGTDGALNITDNDSIINSKNLIFNEYTNKYAVYIPNSVTGTITLDNWIFDGTGIDIYWGGTTGTLSVQLINNSNATTYNSAGGIVEFNTQNTNTSTCDANIVSVQGVPVTDINDFKTSDIQTKLDVLEANIATFIANHNATVQSDIANLDSGLRQVLTNLGDEINQNEILITNGDKTMSVNI